MDTFIFPSYKKVGGLFPNKAFWYTILKRVLFSWAVVVNAYLTVAKVVWGNYATNTWLAIPVEDCKFTLKRSTVSVVFVAKSFIR